LNSFVWRQKLQNPPQLQKLNMFENASLLVVKSKS